MALNAPYMAVHFPCMDLHAPDMAVHAPYIGGAHARANESQRRAQETPVAQGGIAHASTRGKTPVITCPICGLIRPIYGYSTVLITCHTWTSGGSERAKEAGGGGTHSSGGPC